MNSSGNILDAARLRMIRPEVAATLALCLDCAFILLFWTIPLLLLKPFQNAPFVDDWTYAWPVEELLQNHPLRVLEWSSSPNIIQAFWGALFCLHGGFSFAALSFSTWVSAACCLCGFYLMLWALRVPRTGAFLGVATLGANPIFFCLSFTFMTDIPFLALQVWALFALVRGTETRRAGWFVIAAILTACSAGIRPVGIALPAAAAIFQLLRRTRDTAPGNLIYLIMTTVLIAAIFAWWYKHQYSTVNIAGSPGIPKTRLTWLRYSITSLPVTLPGGLMFLAGATGLNLLPLSFAVLRHDILLKCAIVFGAILLSWCAMHFAGITFTLPLSTSSIWEWDGFKASCELVPGWRGPGDPFWLYIPAIIAFASGAIFIAGMEYKSLVAPGALVFWVCASGFALIIILWLFHDRYALVVMPFVIALFLVTQRPPRIKVAIPVIVLFLTFSISGVHNMLAYNEALWNGVTKLRGMGVPDSEIDGGYVVNGWTQYAHPWNAPRDAGGKMYIPWITTATRSLKYKISNQPEKGWELVAALPYSQWGSSSASLYILRHSF